MNLLAIEKMNKNRELADKITKMFMEWVDGREFATGECDEDFEGIAYDLDANDIATPDEWNALQGRIERLLGE